MKIYNTFHQTTCLKSTHVLSRQRSFHHTRSTFERSYPETQLDVPKVYSFLDGRNKAQTAAEDIQTTSLIGSGDWIENNPLDAFKVTIFYAPLFIKQIIQMKRVNTYSNKGLS